MWKKLVDYEENKEPQAPDKSTPILPKKDLKNSYVSIYSIGFWDFLLKPEFLRAIMDVALITPQMFSMCASRRPSRTWMSCARPSLEWERWQSSRWPPYSKLSLSMTRRQFWSCVTQGSWPSISARSTSADSSTCPVSRCPCSLEASPSRRTRKY